jgi:hypothetical protein
MMQIQQLQLCLERIPGSWKWMMTQLPTLWCQQGNYRTRQIQQEILKTFQQGRIHMYQP